MATSGFVCNPDPPPRRPAPKDGPGPRGVPDVYYTSRTLDSTFRYVRFIKKLRHMEEEQRKGNENNLQKLKDVQINDFFNHCDRRQLVNNVTRRVELCMRSYQEDLEKKRARLKERLSIEEEQNIRKFVEQAQAANDTIWDNKMKRLQYLLQKRQKEHEDKYKDTPISKCTHVQPCIVQHRAKEAAEIQLYQIKEKEAQRESERELNKMWHEVTMKGAEALAARMEVDAIERYRRDMDCKNHTDQILAQREKQRAIDRENLKKQQIALKAQFEADKRAAEEEEAARREKHIEALRECQEAVADRNYMLGKRREKDEKLQQIWDSLQGQGADADQAKIDLMKRKEKELDECNRKMIELREEVKGLTDDPIFEQETKRIQEELDKKRCEYLLWSQKTNRDVRKAMIEQIQDRKEAREKLKEKLAEEEQYQNQVHGQLQELLTNKALQDAKARKKHQMDLIKQIEYNKLLKERALQEEMDQRKKAAIAAKEYQDEINRMMCRPQFTDEVHPFMRQMKKPVEMRRTCPCSRQDYCARPGEPHPDSSHPDTQS